MKKHKGMTLLETLIVTSIITIVIGVAVTLFFLGTRSFTAASGSVEVISKARNAMDYLTREVRKADQVTVLENVLTIDTVEIRLMDDRLLEGDKVILSGIEGFTVSEVDEEISLTIIIDREKSEDYTLTSIVYRR